MIDIPTQVAATERAVGRGHLPAGEGRAVRLRRTFDSPIDDVWDAFTDPARIGRWFLPISGDFRLGGRYQFEGNAGGEIVHCERPNRLKVTWVYMDTGNPADVSEVEIRLTDHAGTSTTVELEHTAIVPDDAWAMFGPGAVGVGWDGGMLGLALHLERGGGVDDPIAWQLSDEGRAWSTACSEAWGAANIAAGADPELAAAGVAATTAFYTTAPDGASA